LKLAQLFCALQSFVVQIIYSTFGFKRRWSGRVARTTRPDHLTTCQSRKL